MVSPSCLSHRISTPSVIDADADGMMISVATIPPGRYAVIGLPGDGAAGMG